MLWATVLLPFLKGLHRFATPVTQLHPALRGTTSPPRPYPWTEVVEVMTGLPPLAGDDFTGHTMRLLACILIYCLYDVSCFFSE